MGILARVPLAMVGRNHRQSSCLTHPDLGHFLSISSMWLCVPFGGGLLAEVLCWVWTICLTCNGDEMVSMFVLKYWEMFFGIDTRSLVRDFANAFLSQIALHAPAFRSNYTSYVNHLLYVQIWVVQCIEAFPRDAIMNFHPVFSKPHFLLHSPQQNLISECLQLPDPRLPTWLSESLYDVAQIAVSILQLSSSPTPFHRCASPSCISISLESFTREREMSNVSHCQQRYCLRYDNIIDCALEITLESPYRHQWR